MFKTQMMKNSRSKDDSSSDDDVVITGLWASNARPLPKVVRKIKTEYSSSDEDEQPLLAPRFERNIIKYKNKIQRTNDYMDKRELFKFREEKCEFCELVTQTRYDLLVHNARHMRVTCHNESLFQCDYCNEQFATEKQLNRHNKKHKLKKTQENDDHTIRITNNIHNPVPDILKDIIKNTPVVRCENIVTDLLIDSNEKKLDKILTKQAIVECDNTITEFVMQSNEKKLDKIINKEAVVKCMDISSPLKDFVFKEPLVRCEDTIRQLENLNKKSNVPVKVKSSPKKDVFVNQNVIDCTVDESILGNVEPSEPIYPSKEMMLLKSIDVEEPISSEESILGLFGDDFKQESDFVATDTQFIKPALPGMATISKISGDNTIQNGIRSQITFDDDDEEDMITCNNQDLEDGFGASLETFDLTADSDDDVSVTNSKIMIGSNEEFSPAIHYKELTKLGMFKCKRCGLTYPNRYDLILHETTHINLSRDKTRVHLKRAVCRGCDRYIIGNMQSHLQAEHPNLEVIANQYLKSCKVCKLKFYSFIRHQKNYHLIYFCKSCAKRFHTEKELDEHNNKCPLPLIPLVHKPFTERLIIKFFKLCEVCLMMKKSSKLSKYIYIREYSEEGKRVRCESCNKEFFVLMLVQRISKHKAKHSTVQLNETERKQNLLKKFRNRLKMLNKMT